MRELAPNLWLLPGAMDSPPSLVMRRKNNSLLMTDPGLFWFAFGKNWELARLRRATGANLHGVLLTHSHPDHIGNLRHVAPGVPVYCHKKSFWSLRSPGKLLEAGRILARKTGNSLTGFTAADKPLAKLYGAVASIACGPKMRHEGMWGEDGGVYGPFPPDGFQFDGYHVEVIETPGHCPGEVAFWIPEYGILIGGDLVPNRPGRERVPSIYTPEGNLFAAQKSLVRIKALKPRMIIPGHGDPIEDVEERLAILERSTQQILRRVQMYRLGDPSRTASKLVELVFADLPYKLRPNEKRCLVLSVLQHADT
ncbi:MAG: MBL fold metallo-hydrolase [Patescibacteria group bacterium]